jgi:hypothetical protein
MRQLCLLDRRADASDDGGELGEAVAACQFLLQNIRRMVLEITEHDAIRPLFSKRFHGITEFASSIREDGAGSSATTLGQLSVRSCDGFGVPSGARCHRQDAQIRVRQRRSAGRQLRGADPHDHQHFLGADLIGMVGHPDPIVSRFDRLFDQRDADAHQPVANRAPSRRVGVDL